MEHAACERDDFDRAILRATEKALKDSSLWNRMRHATYMASFNAEMAAQGFPREPDDGREHGAA